MADHSNFFSGSSPAALERHLWQAAGRAFEQLFRWAPGAGVVHVPGAMLAVTGLPAPDLNCGVVGDGDDPAVATRSLVDELHGRNLPGLLLITDAAGRGAHDAAETSGLVRAARMPLMVCADGPMAVDSRFVTRRATTRSDLAAANCLIAAAFELPAATVDAAFGPQLLDAADVAVELTCDGDEPVGCLQVTDSKSLVGIWSMATPPAQRRRGVARSGLTHVLEGRFTAGASLAYLIATEAGRPLYDAVGFRVVAWCTAWAFVPAVVR